MKILVTGGAGFIGSHLVDKLIHQKHQVTVVDDLSTGKKANLNPQAKFYKFKIQDKYLTKIFQKEKPQVVYHLAAQMNVRKSIQDPMFDAQVNILGAINLFENCVKYKVKKIIFISTGGAIYGDGVKMPTPENALEAPISPYGIAKLSVEKYLHYYHQQYKLPYTVLRLANIYGPRQNYLGEAGVVAIYCNSLKNNKALIVNGGQQTRDFVYVADVVDTAFKVLKSKKSVIYNIGTGKETTIQKLAEQVIKISRHSVKIIKKPYIKGEQLQSCLSSSKIKRELHWQPQYTLQQGLKKTWDYFKNN